MGALHALITITTASWVYFSSVDSKDLSSPLQTDYFTIAILKGPYLTDAEIYSLHGPMLEAIHCFNDSANPGDFVIKLDTAGNPNRRVTHIQLVAGRNPYRYDKKRSINLNSKVKRTASVGDIALLKLASAATFNQYIMPICLPSSSVTFPCVMECWVTGRGRTSSKGPTPVDGMLKKVMAQFTDYKTCDRMHQKDDAKNAKIVIIQDEKKCAGNKNGQKDSCVGDSGETVVCKVQDSWYQIGVASRGEGCPANRSGAYTLVTSDQDCISSYLQEKFNNVTDIPSPTKICGGGNNRTNCASSNKTGDSPSKNTRGDVRLSVQENGGTTAHHHSHWMILGPVTLLLLNM